MQNFRLVVALLWAFTLHIDASISTRALLESSSQGEQQGTELPKSIFLQQWLNRNIISNPLEGTTYTFYASLSWSSELQMNRWTEFESGKDVCARIMGSDPVHFVVVSVYRTHQLLPRWQNYLNARARYYDVMVSKSEFDSYTSPTQAPKNSRPVIPLMHAREDKRWMLYHVMDPSARYFNGPAFPTPAGGPKAIASVLKKACEWSYPALGNQYGGMCCGACTTY